MARPFEELKRKKFTVTLTEKDKEIYDFFVGTKSSSQLVRELLTAYMKNPKEMELLMLKLKYENAKVEDKTINVEKDNVKQKNLEFNKVKNSIFEITDEDLKLLEAEDNKFQEEKIECFNRRIKYCPQITQKHKDITANIIAILKDKIDSSCKIFSESIEVKFEDENKGELYKLKPDVFVLPKEFECENETITTIPKIIFEIASKESEEYDLVKKMEVYRVFGVLEYNVILEEKDVIIQHFLNDAGNYDLAINKKGDRFKSIIYEELNIPIEHFIEEDYQKKLIESKKLNEKINIAKKFLDILDDEIIAIKTDLSVEEVKNLRGNK